MARTKRKGYLVLVHWEDEEAKELAAPLQADGWLVRLGSFELKDLKANPPMAVLISLRRLPSHGREVADALWYAKWGRAIPIIFFDGEPDKVEATRKKFPAAQFAAWEELPTLLPKLERVPEEKETAIDRGESYATFAKRRHRQYNSERKCLVTTLAFATWSGASPR